MPKLNSNSKPLLLFATPRSGSTPVYLLLLGYLESLSQAAGRDINGLGEFFDLTSHTAWVEDGRVVISKYPKSITPDKTDLHSSFAVGMMQKIVLGRRLEMIRPEPERYLFKLFPNHLMTFPRFQEVAFPWLVKNYDWLFLERRDLWGQMLSFVISMETDIWYEPLGIHLKNTLQISRRHFEMFENHVWNYEQHKMFLHPKHVLVYEDFCKMPPDSFLALAGLKEQADFSKVYLPRKQHEGPKEKNIGNIEEVRQWFESSFLTRLQEARLRLSTQGKA